MSDTPIGPNWFPDPSGKHEYRWWDGTQWTDQVASHGRASTDPVTPGAFPTTRPAAGQIAKQVAKSGAAPGRSGGGTLFTEPILVVNQKTKLIEVNTEYAVFDQHGNQVAAVRQVGQSAMKKVMRVVSSLDQFFTHSYQVVDTANNVLLTLTRPAKIMKSRVEISDGQGQAIGSVIQKNMFGKIRFSLESNGQALGSINAENWRAWNFNITDADGREIARITKTFEGIAKTLFTTADNYVLQLHDVEIAEPLRSLVVASALVVDTALKQDQRGLG